MSRVFDACSRTILHDCKLLHASSEGKLYFSLSMSEGQTTGRSLLAQSSSEKRSDVAARACKAALRPCTKGSRSDLEKAAISTLDRVCDY